MFNISLDIKHLIFDLCVVVNCDKNLIFLVKQYDDE